MRLRSKRISSLITYGYTDEYSGDSTQLTYLRSRYYSSGTGRFLTQDTWTGDANSPISYNKWVYVYQNPINLLDPTGMKPGDSKYCFPLSGRDSQYCNNIVRGINPDLPMTAGDYIVFDQLGPCYTPPLPLYEVLPHRLNQFSRTEEYGWWFHYLVDKAPGWWNNYGKDHVYFSDVIAFAIGAEMSSFRDYEFGLLLAHGFANKGWKEGMYRMLGGRQSASVRTNSAIYGSENGGSYQICGKTNNNPSCKPFNQVISEFAGVLEGINLTLNGNHITNNVLDLGHMVLWRSSWRNWDDNAPYEWGNPTEYSKNFPKFINALSGSAGPNYDQVLYHSMPTLQNPIVAYVISKTQMDWLCNQHSCVAP